MAPKGMLNRITATTSRALNSKNFRVVGQGHLCHPSFWSAKYSHQDGTNAISPWQTEISRKLDNGSATVIVLAMGPGTPNFGSALGIRMTVSVTWTELGRQQTVALSTTRF